MSDQQTIGSPAPTTRSWLAKHCIDIANTLGLWAAAIVGVWAIITSRNDADQQRDIYKQQVQVMKAQLNPHLDFEPNILMNGAASRYDFTPIWHNTGGGQAVDVTTWVNSKIFDSKDMPQASYFLDPHRDIEDNPRDIGPQGKTIILTQSIPFSDSEAIANGSKTEVVWGYVSYRSLFPDMPVQKQHFCALFVLQKVGNTFQNGLPALYKSACNKKDE